MLTRMLLYADVISFFVTRKCPKNPLNRWKKLVLTEQKLHIFLNDLRNSNEISKKDVAYDKSQKNLGIHSLSRG